MAKSNNPTDLLENTQRCHKYCSSAMLDSTHCNISCDDINNDAAENIRMQTLIFGRYTPDAMSIDSLSKSH